MELKERKPGDCFRSRAYCVNWWSVIGTNGVVHHKITEKEQLELSEKYKQGKVKHALMEFEL